MNTIKDVAAALSAGRSDKHDVALAQKTGLSRQSISRVLSGKHNFSVSTLLALAEANGQELVLLPRGVARALISPQTDEYVPIATKSSNLRDL